MFMIMSWEEGLESAWKWEGEAEDYEEAKEKAVWLKERQPQKRIAIFRGNGANFAMDEPMEEF